RLTLMRPVVFISLIAGAAIFYSNHFVEPPTQRAVRDLIIEGRSDLLTSLISEGQFARPEKNLVFYVDGKSSDGALTGLMISDTRDPAAQLTYYAKNAVIGEINGQEALAMSSGQIHRRDTETGDISVIQFDSYALGLGQLGSAASTATYFLHERDTSDLLNPDPEDRFVQKWPGQPFAEVMKRSSEWLFPLLFGMIALVIAGQPQSHRKSNGVTMFYAFGAAMIYRWATYYLYNEAKNAPDLAYLLAAIPLIGVCLGVWMFLRGIEFKPEGVISVQWDRLARLFPKKRPAAG
ncbi:MAG: LptF/LptG family permease, partial [Pseudomonadota bacterium]